MERRNWVVCALITAALLSGTCYTYAQKGKWVKSTSRAVSPKSSFPSLANRIHRNALLAQQQRDIRLSVARLDHAILLDGKTPLNQLPHSTAFLFTTHYNGRPSVWAVTAGHTAQLGEKLRLTFYNGKKEIPVDGTLVQQGPALLSNAALIRLESVPAELRPLTLTTDIDPQEKLTTWGYASNKFYQIDNLTFEKDNTRFIRTDFPATQTKRSGLCGGPLLNAQGHVLGIHCGSTWEDKSYAASVRIIPYLLQAYYEGNAQIPLVAKGVEFGSIRLDERIIYLQCADQSGDLINQEDIYDQLPQSLIMELYQDPEVRFMRFVLGSYQNNNPSYRVLVYDKQTRTHTFEPFRYLKRHYE